MAEALLRHKLALVGAAARVRSAGLLEDGNPASAHGVDVLAERGIDLSGHRSQVVHAELLRGSDLILAMAREHVREAVVKAQDVWPRTFTLKEIVRRGRQVGPREDGESIADWLALVHAGRSTRELMGQSSEDDVADPIGGPRGAYEVMVADVDRLVDELVRLVWSAADDYGSSGSGGGGGDPFRSEWAS